MDSSTPWKSRTDAVKVKNKTTREVKPPTTTQVRPMGPSFSKAPEGSVHRIPLIYNFAPARGRR
jgi:hypothetical protein